MTWFSAGSRPGANTNRNYYHYKEGGQRPQLCLGIGINAHRTVEKPTAIAHRKKSTRHARIAKHSLGLCAVFHRRLLLIAPQESNDTRTSELHCFDFWTDLYRRANLAAIAGVPNLSAASRRPHIPPLLTQKRCSDNTSGSFSKAARLAHQPEFFMSIGKTIRLYLADATVTGIRHGEIANWTGQAISCPRSKLQALSEWSEAKRPGVYFLFGTDEDSGQEAVYIGEAEVVFDRLVSHLAQKDFWSEVVAFTSKDDNLTKGHVRYLESRLVEMARQVDRYVVKNGNTPQLPALPRPDRDAMEEYLDASRILLGVLGHRVLEPLVAAPKKTEPEIQGGAAPNPSARTDFILLTAFRLSMSGIQAFATKTDEGFVVMESSEAAKQIQQSLSPGYRTLRDKLIQTHVLVADGEKLRFSRNQLFSSPTQAAAIVLGYSINGREAWRTQNNQSYGALEESIANGSLKLLFDRG